MEQQKNNKGNKAICISCNKPYNIEEKINIISRACEAASAVSRSLPAAPTSHICLACRQAELAISQQEQLPDLQASAIALQDTKQTYMRALSTHQYLTIQYEATDRQHKYINFFLMQQQAKSRNEHQAKTNRKAGNKKRKSTNQKNMVLALLATLTPEQQAMVANLSKQKQS